MANFSDKELAIAGVYAAALLEVAEAQGQADELLDELLELSKMIEGSEDFALFLSSPMIETKAKERTIEKLFRGRCSDVLVDALQVLNRKGRLELVRGVAERYRVAHSDLRCQVDVEVKTAVPLPGRLRDPLAALLATSTGKTPRLIETVDSSMLGGLVVQIGDEKFDMSIARRLAGLKQAMMQRASREIHSGRSWFDSGGAVGDRSAIA